MIKPSTSAVRAWRALGRPPNQQWVDWAVQRLVAGDDTPSLRILAGLTGPFDQIETDQLADNTLAELKIEPLGRDDAVSAYATELLEDLLNGHQPTDTVLKELGSLCVDASYNRELYPFYLLNNARDGLSKRDFQAYWKGADRSNIETIVRDQASEWLRRHGRAL